MTLTTLLILCALWMQGALTLFILYILGRRRLPLVTTFSRCADQHPRAQQAPLHPG